MHSADHAKARMASHYTDGKELIVGGSWTWRVAMMMRMIV